MSKLGLGPLSKQRQRQSPLVLLCCFLFLSSLTLSLTLYSARRAHEKLLGGLKEQGGILGSPALVFQLLRRMATFTLSTYPCLTMNCTAENKINRLHQKMAEMKVESVDLQNRAEDSETQRNRVQDMLDRVSKELEDVCLSLCMCVCAKYFVFHSLIFGWHSTYT